ncbi:hypothetical protein [Candidatus Liberibacter brunswickensis]|uniref:hypothetical protein n=1 Tax=Candidatus Liberibacter brunswickensis TaxID=1968796 RepID=UPI002FE3716C
MVIENSINPMTFKDRVVSIGLKWTAGNVWLLFGIVVVYFSISFSSRVVDYYIEKNHFSHIEYKNSFY